MVNLCISMHIHIYTISTVSPFCPPSLLDEPHCPWIIALTTAANALFVYHLLLEKDFSAILLGHILVDEGICFCTLQSLPNLSIPPSIKNVCAVIPIHIKDYSFKVSNYHSYVQEQVRLLSSPWGCAALLEGGIIGWIAKEHLGHDSVALGSSSAVTIHHQGFSFTDAAGITYWDDRLTDDEICMICGVYCYTGIMPLPNFIYLLLILSQVMVLNCQMFLGGLLLFIGITTMPTASIGGTGLSGMKFGTKNEWQTFFQLKGMVFHLHNLPGRPN